MQLREQMTPDHSRAESMTVEEPLAAAPATVQETPVLVEPRDTFYARRGKRIFDLVVTLPILVVLLPLFATVALFGLCLRWTGCGSKEPKGVGGFSTAWC